MKITDPQHLKNYFRAIGIKPKDYLGQNFLVDDEVLKKIIKTADLKSSDTVLEIGPGLGILTGELVKNSKEVLAVEKDPRLASLIKKEFADVGKLKIINEDVLRFELDKYISGPYKVVANIPYYLTSKLFQYFLEQKNPPELMVLMVQKEVAQRAVAKTGELSILGISIQVHSDAEIFEIVSKNSFWPVPEVDSAILKIIPKSKYPQIEDKKLFFSIVKIAFAGKRKQILNSLSNGLHISKSEVGALLSKAGIEPSARPQDIAIDRWISLYKEVGLAKK